MKSPGLPYPDIRVFSKDIGMKFGTDKCVMLMMKKGKIVKSDGIELPNERAIKSLEKVESYKHLGASEPDELMINVIKEKVKKVCYR